MGNNTPNRPLLLLKYTQNVDNPNLFPQSLMNIILQLANGQAYHLYIDTSMTVSELKISIYHQLSHTLQPKCMQLWHKNKPLPEDQIIGAIIFDNGFIMQKKAPLKQISRIQVMSRIQDEITLQKGVAVMSCGHNMGRTAIIQFLKATVQQKKYQLLCPFCFKEWSYDLCRRVGNLTREQNLYYMVQLNKNWMAIKTRSCPGCGQPILRNDEGCDRARCANSKCKFGWFCMKCLKKWKNQSSSQCGNLDCSFLPYFRQVADIKMSLYEGSNKIDVTVPSQRLCPCCNFAIEYDEGCKHMFCPQCKNYFCWVCLSVLKGSWSCGMHNQYCGKVAPRQQFK